MKSVLDNRYNNAYFVENVLDCFVYKLRNNVFGMQGIADRLSNENEGDDSHESHESRESLKLDLQNLIKRQAIITQMIFPTFSTLLDYSWIEAPNDVVNFYDTISEVLGIFRHEFEKIKQMKIDFGTLCEKSGFIGSRDTLKNIIYLILSRIESLSWTGDKLKISCTKQEQWVEIHIKHTGRQLSEDKLLLAKRVLNMNVYDRTLYSLDESMLDLMIVRRLVEELGCRIDFFWSVDHSMYTFYIPKEKVFQPIQSLSNGNALMTTRYQPSSIIRDFQVKSERPPLHFLLIDDDQYCLSTLCSMIKRLGYKCACFYDAVEGYAYYVENSKTIDGVFLDLEMPLLSGNEIADRIFKYEQMYMHGQKSTKIICLTGYQSSQKKQQKSQNIIDFINKPINEEDLSKLIFKHFIQLV